MVRLIVAGSADARASRARSLGAGVGAAARLALAHGGLDFSRYLGRQLFVRRACCSIRCIYGDFGRWIVPYVFVVAMAATVSRRSIPAWYAARTDPAVALRVAQ